MSGDQAGEVMVEVTALGVRMPARSALVAWNTAETIALIDALHQGADALGGKGGALIRSLANVLCDETELIAQDPGTSGGAEEAGS